MGWGGQGRYARGAPAAPGRVVGPVGRGAPRQGCQEHERRMAARIGQRDRSVKLRDAASGPALRPPDDQAADRGPYRRYRS